MLNKFSLTTLVHMNYESPSGKVTQAVRAHLAVNRESIATLAQTTNISESTIKRRLNGLSFWTIEEMVLIADHFSISVSSLLNPSVLIRVAG